MVKGAGHKSASAGVNGPLELLTFLCHVYCKVFEMQSSLSLKNVIITALIFSLWNYAFFLLSVGDRFTLKTS